MALPDRFEFALPTWAQVIDKKAPANGSDTEKMSFAIELARENIRRKSGGPFGAAIFSQNDGSLVSVGVNLVTSVGCSVLHAEIVAIIMAQRALGTFDLSSRRLELHSSTEPCAMCLGAIPWSGIRRLVCGARDEDARLVGFDEGAKPRDWNEVLKNAGIDVVVDVCRDNAKAVLEEYARSGGVIYNAGKNDQSQ